MLRQETFSGRPDVPCTLPDDRIISDCHSAVTRRQGICKLERSSNAAVVYENRVLTGRDYGKLRGNPGEVDANAENLTDRKSRVFVRKMYQLDANNFTMIFSHKWPLHVSDIYMSIFRSSYI